MPAPRDPGPGPRAAPGASGCVAKLPRGALAPAAGGQSAAPSPRAPLAPRPLSRGAGRRGCATPGAGEAAPLPPTPVPSPAGTWRSRAGMGHLRTCLHGPPPWRGRAGCRGCKHLAVAGATEGLERRVRGPLRWGRVLPRAQLGAEGAGRGQRVNGQEDPCAVTAHRVIASPGPASFCWFPGPSEPRLPPQEPTDLGILLRVGMAHVPGAGIGCSGL